MPAIAIASLTLPGPQNNIPLLRDIITHPKYQSGNISTKFMPQVYPDGFHGPAVQSVLGLGSSALQASS